MRAAHLLKLRLARAVVNHRDLVLAALLVDLVMVVGGSHTVDWRCALSVVRVVDVTRQNAIVLILVMVRRVCAGQLVLDV